jgi:anaerobic glycerol-3-phosphate dehydrogenase
MREGDAMTPATIQLAKDAQHHDRVYAIADLLAGFDDVVFRTAGPRVRALYLEAAAAAMAAAHLEKLKL